MRKQLCTIASLFITTFAGAQTEKGNGLISGSLSVSSSWADNKSANTSLRAWQPSLNVTVGRFVADNWLVGASVLAGTVFTRSERPSYIGTIERPITQRTDNLQLSFMPFVRRYWQFAPVQVFAGVGLSASINSQRQRNDELTVTTGIPQLNTIKQRTTSWTANPYLEAGVNYFLTKRLALQVAATATSLPLNVGELSTGLVYWTGSDRAADPQEERSNGQTNRGNWIVEGSFIAGRSSSGYENGNATNKVATGTYSLRPSVAYFIRKNSMLGVAVPLQFIESRSSAQNRPASSINFWSVGISPYYQHYWTSTRLTPYTRVEASFLQFNYGSNARSIYSTSATAGVGMAYMAGQRFIIETSVASATLAYTPSTGSEDGSRLWNAYLSAGLRGNFAIRYVLTGAK